MNGIMQKGNCRVENKNNPPAPFGKGEGKKKRKPVNLKDDNEFLKFAVEYIKFRMTHGTCRLTIHGDGMGMVYQVEEYKVEKL